MDSLKKSQENITGEEKPRRRRKKDGEEKKEEKKKDEEEVNQIEMHTKKTEIDSSDSE